MGDFSDSMVASSRWNLCALALALLLAVTFAASDGGEDVAQLTEQSTSAQLEEADAMLSSPSDDAQKEKAVKMEKKLAGSKQGTHMRESAGKAKWRTKYLSEATVKESKLKTEEKSKQKHYQNLFRLGMRFRHLSGELEATTDKALASKLKLELQKISKNVPKSYVKMADKDMQKLQEKEGKKEEKLAKKAEKKSKKSEKKAEKKAEKKVEKPKPKKK